MFSVWNWYEFRGSVFVLLFIEVGGKYLWKLSQQFHFLEYTLQKYSPMCIGIDV